MGFFKKKNKQITFIENAGGMIITKSIYEGTSKLKWFFREESVNPSDNGWRAIGDNDTQEYLNNPENSIVLGSGEINHFGPGENRQFWSNENHQSGVASPQVVLFTRPAAGQPVSQ